MPDALTLIHTASVHSDTFNALRDRIAPGTELRHVVRSDWLASAQSGITPFLAQEIKDAIAEFGDAVMCTCTTIGPVAEAAGALRIDRPLMQAAAAQGAPVLMAYCLESTRAPSLALLEEEMSAAGNASLVHMLPLLEHWRLFEAGQSAEFAAAIAKSICKAAIEIPDLGCIVLAQASMVGAAPLLSDLPIPVLSSPELALRAGLARI